MIRHGAGRRRGARDVGACSEGGIEKDCTHLRSLLRDILLVLHWHPHVRVIQDTHDDGTSAVSTLVLGKVVATRKFLTAVGALEWLVVGVKRSIVALEMFLTAEATGAQGADKGL